VRIRNTLLWLLCGGILGLLLMREQERGTFVEWDGRQRDLMARHPWAAGYVAVREPAVVLGRLDDRDREERVFEQWPLTQGDWQVLLQNLKDYGPRQTVVGSGVVGPGTAGLADAARAIRGLTVAAPVSAVALGGGSGLPLDWPVLECAGPVQAIPEVGRVLPPALPGALGAGELDLGQKRDRVAVDGESCRVPLVLRVGDRVVPGVVLRAVMEWQGVSPGEVRVIPGVAVQVGAGVRIPVDAAGGFTYHRPFAPRVPVFGADLFSLPKAQVESVVGEPERALLGRLPGSLLWIGEDDLAGRRLVTADGEQLSPAAVMAQAVAVIQTGRYVQPAQRRRQWMVAGIALLVGAWLIHWPRWLVLPGISAAGAALAAAGWHRFHVEGEWFPAIPAAGVLALCGLLAFLLPRVARAAGTVPVAAGEPIPDAGAKPGEMEPVHGGGEAPEADEREETPAGPVAVESNPAGTSPGGSQPVGVPVIPVDPRDGGSGVAAGGDDSDTEGGSGDVAIADNHSLLTEPESVCDAVGQNGPEAAGGSGGRGSGGRKKRKRR
jgi:hypothetical protein